MGALSIVRVAEGGSCWGLPGQSPGQLRLHGCWGTASVLGWLLDSDLFLIRVRLGLKSRFGSCQLQLQRGHRLSPKGCGGRAPETVVSAVCAAHQWDTHWGCTVGPDWRSIYRVLRLGWQWQWLLGPGALGCWQLSLAAARTDALLQGLGQCLWSESEMRDSSSVHWPRRPASLQLLVQCCRYIAYSCLLLPEPLDLFLACSHLHEEKTGISHMETLLPIWCWCSNPMYSFHPLPLGLGEHHVWSWCRNSGL